MQKECSICGKVFTKNPRSSYKEWERRKYCSKKCASETFFQKGHELGRRFKPGEVPWNKGTKGIMKSNSGSFKKGNVPMSWKGNNVGYFALHNWLRRHKGFPEVCEHCDKVGEFYEFTMKKSGKTRKRWTIEWANIDHKYNRNLEEYIGLCVKCHRNYDKQFKEL